MLLMVMFSFSSKDGIVSEAGNRKGALSTVAPVDTTLLRSRGARCGVELGLTCSSLRFLEDRGELWGLELGMVMSVSSPVKERFKVFTGEELEVEHSQGFGDLYCVFVIKRVRSTWLSNAVRRLLAACFRPPLNLASVSEVSTGSDVAFYNACEAQSVNMNL